MKILITGIAGFAGSYLAEYLINSGVGIVIGTYLKDSNLSNLSQVKDKVTLVPLDLLDRQSVFELIDQHKPNEIYHLAALTAPSLSFEDPAKIITNNIEAEVHVLEALRRLHLEKTKTLIISSADIYGKVKKEDLPMDEQTSLYPANPYAVSKIAQDFLGLQYFLSYNLSIVRVRPFNHIGPRQSPSFVIGAFAKQIAEIEKGRKEPVITVGSLDARRDFTDVRDMVKAYVLALQKATIGDVYNIGSGKSHTIKDILSMLLSFSSKKITVKHDQKRVRPSDTPELLSNPQKFMQLTGWKPEIPLEKTLSDTLDYWRNIL